MHMVQENISCTKQQYMYFFAFPAASAKALTRWTHYPLSFFNLLYLPIIDKRGGLECECVCGGGGGMGEGYNFGIRKALIGRIYTSFYVVPKMTIAYEAP